MQCNSTPLQNTVQLPRGLRNEHNKNDFLHLGDYTSNSAWAHLITAFTVEDEMEKQRKKAFGLNPFNEEHKHN